MKKILIAEDHEDVLRAITDALPQDWTVITAPSELLAIRQFEAHQGQFDAIALDGNLKPGNGSRLAAHFHRSGYKGPMIAMSENPDMRKRMMEAGCNHEVQKGNIVEKLRELLG